MALYWPIGTFKQDQNVVNKVIDTIEVNPLKVIIKVIQNHLHAIKSSPMQEIHPTVPEISHPSENPFPHTPY